MLGNLLFIIISSKLLHFQFSLLLLQTQLSSLDWLFDLLFTDFYFIFLYFVYFGVSCCHWLIFQSTITLNIQISCMQVRLIFEIVYIVIIWDNILISIILAAYYTVIVSVAHLREVHKLLGISFVLLYVVVSMMHFSLSSLDIV